jgi:hypothetical protein
MKLNIVKAISIAGLLLISQLAQAGPPPVMDTFVVGQPLTAAQMNNIKALVEYNQLLMFFNRSRIYSLEIEPATTVTTVAPTPDDDVDLDNSIAKVVGSVWVNTTNGDAYISTDDTANSAVWKLITHAPTVYALGDTGPAGGFVFYVTGDGLHGLEAAPEDIGGNATPTLVAWGCNGTTLEGMNETGVGSGAHNTSQRDLCAEAPTAAKKAAAYEFNGYTDWFLPARDELDLMWENLADPEGDGRGDPFDSDSKGGFAGASYWSSSQYNLDYAWNQHFADRAQLDGSDKAYGLRVRAVRAF